MITYRAKHENAFFKRDDLWTNIVQGYEIPPEWWSRLYEYPWALEYAAPDMVVADMGCGWEQRPFKDMLSKVCHKVYAVDQHWEAGKLTPHDNMEFVIADFTRHIDAIPDDSLDAVFCISVLEELGDTIPMALHEFYRCLKPGGLCVLTCDVQYDMDKPLGPFGAVKLGNMISSALSLGFEVQNGMDYDKYYAVNHEGFNLCVYHCVLVKP